MRASWIRVVLAIFFVPGQAMLAQSTASTEQQSANIATTAQITQELNIQEYIKLLREDVSSQKAKLVGQVMQFDAEDAAKFWPIYRDYDAELQKVNDLRVANIVDYSRSYTNMTDAKADELIKNAMTFQKQRDELLGKYYERVKQELGAVTAARFVQVEHQLLTIIDLKITSSLPVIGS
jgi:hypothetical protein